MTNYTLDTERWLRSQAKIYALRQNLGMAATFERCADDVKRLKMAGDLNQQGADHMLDEMTKLTAELTALKAAARPVANLVTALSESHNAGSWAGYQWACGTAAVTSQQMDELARLCGEEKRYTRETCPKSDTWFSEGGACGKAWDCKECADAPNRECGEE